MCSEKRKICIEKINAFLDSNFKGYKHWNKILSSLDINNYNIYVINVAYDGNGEDDDTFYSYVHEQNYKKYDDGNYCFKIITSEYM